jgi:hypothetical protein
MLMYLCDGEATLSVTQIGRAYGAVEANTLGASAMDYWVGSGE